VERPSAIARPWGDPQGRANSRVFELCIVYRKSPPGVQLMPSFSKFNIFYAHLYLLGSAPPLQESREIPTPHCNSKITHMLVRKRIIVTTRSFGMRIALCRSTDN
jgi:hypothetical protein